MTQITLYDQKNIDQLPWPDTEEAAQARALLLPMIKEGVETFIRNVDTQLYVLLVGNQLIPITVNVHEYNNSYLTSNYFPIKYLEEKLSLNSSFMKRVKKSLVQGVGCLLKGVKINKAVIVNNWLLTTNIYAALSQSDLQEVTRFLSERFPDHILIFRSLNTRKCQDLVQDLKKQHYRLLYARHVCIYDPHEKRNFSAKVHYHHRRDRRLIGSEGYEIVRYDQVQPAEKHRLLNLYNDLYLSRHTMFSPQYTEKFLQEALQKKYLILVGLKKEGEVKGVIGFHEREGTLIAPFCGYNNDHGESNHLYRMLTILAIDEADTRGVLLNDGSGGEAPKQYRGMRTFPEYVALYDKHLPFHRRFFWGMAEKVVSKLHKFKQPSSQ